MRSGLLFALLIASMTMAAAAVAQEPLPPPPPPPHGEPPPTPLVEVTVDSAGKPVVLERRVKKDEMEGRTLFLIPRREETQTWEQVCVAPCTLHVDRASTYRISHENFVTQSGTFLMPAQGEQVKIDVLPGNWWWHNVGTKAIGVGVVAGIVGASLITVAHTWDKHESEVHVRRVGIITASVGLLALAVGIPLAIMTRTKVTENGIKVGNSEPNNRPRLTLDGLVF